MQAEEVIDVLNDPVAQNLLNSPNLARLAYIGKDGAPRAIPIGFHWNGEMFVLATVPRSAKVAALEANPKVAMTIDTSSFPPKVLLVRGTATIAVIDGIPDEYIEGGRKFIDAESFPAWEQGVRGLYDQMARIEIVPTWAKIHDFETRIPSAVEELVREKMQQ